MPEVIGFPDAEATAIAFLKAQLTARGKAVPTGTKVPNPRPPLFVRISRTGGTSRDIVTDSPTLLFECCGDDDVAVSDLATLCRAIVLAGARLSNTITRVVDGGGVAFLPDPDTGNPRYQFVAQLDLRGHAI
jgi:hypothetical protein